MGVALVILLQHEQKAIRRAVYSLSGDWDTVFVALFLEGIQYTSLEGDCCDPGGPSNRRSGQSTLSTVIPVGLNPNQKLGSEFLSASEVSRKPFDFCEVLQTILGPFLRHVRHCFLSDKLCQYAPDFWGVRPSRNITTGAPNFCMVQGSRGSSSHEGCMTGASNRACGSLRLWLYVSYQLGPKISLRKIRYWRKWWREYLQPRRVSPFLRFSVL